MSFFISQALAADAPAAAAQQPDPIMSFLPLILIFVVFYFLLIRPQQKRAKEHKSMVETLKKGDYVVTNGGLLGRITDLGENFVKVSVSEGVEVKIQRASIAALMPKEAVKDL
jgi:preprotein translocase subunit YajC